MQPAPQAERIAPRPSSVTSKVATIELPFVEARAPTPGPLGSISRLLVPAWLSDPARDRLLLRSGAHVSRGERALMNEFPNNSPGAASTSHRLHPVVALRDQLTQTMTAARQLCRFFATVNDPGRRLGEIR